MQSKLQSRASTPYVVFFIALSGLVLPLNVMAEQPETQPGNEKSAPPQTEPAPASDAEDFRIDENKKPSIFIPSEEISEDLSVSFPVDI
jgi:hypothetical protein